MARIGALCLAHQAMAAAEPGTGEHAQAGTHFDQALQVIDTTRREQARIYSLHPAAKKVLATLDRECASAHAMGVRFYKGTQNTGTHTGAH